MFVRCPICGTVMERFGRGATERKHGKQWTCPKARRNIATIDDTGHRWLWTESEIEAARQPIPAITSPAEHPF